MKTALSFTLALALSAGVAHANSEKSTQQARVGTPQANPAAVVTYSGTTTGGPAWNRPAVNSASDCGQLSASGTATPYSAQSFYVDTAGAYDLFSDQGYGKAGGPAPQGGFDGYIVLYRDSFNPASPLSNCVGGNDDANGTIGLSEMLGVPLDANRTYVLVTTGFANADDGAFDNEIAGPGAIFLGPAPFVSIAVDSLGRDGLLLLGLVLGVAGLVAARRYS